METETLQRPSTGEEYEIDEYTVWNRSGGRPDLVGTRGELTRRMAREL